MQNPAVVFLLNWNLSWLLSVFHMSDRAGDVVLILQLLCVLSLGFSHDACRATVQRAEVGVRKQCWAHSNRHLWLDTAMSVIVIILYHHMIAVHWHGLQSEEKKVKEEMPPKKVFILSDALREDTERLMAENKRVQDLLTELHQKHHETTLKVSLEAWHCNFCPFALNDLLNNHCHSEIILDCVDERPVHFCLGRVKPLPPKKMELWLAASSSDLGLNISECWVVWEADSGRDRGCWDEKSGRGVGVQPVDGNEQGG